MKKLLIFILTLLSLILTLNATEQVLINFSYSDTWDGIGNSVNWKAQTFNYTTNFNITAVYLNLSYVGTTGSTLYVNITATNASDNPNNPYYCGGSLSSTSLINNTYNRVVLSGCPTFNASTKYAIVFYGNGDSANYFRYSIKGVGGYTNGTPRYSSNSGATWASGGSYDTSFYITNGSDADTTPPEVNSMTMNDTSLRLGETAVLTIVFSEAVYNFSNSDITTNESGSLGTLTSSNNITWTGTFTPTTGVTDLTNVITLSKVGLWDAYNNSGVGTNSTANYIVDTTAPSLSVIFPSEFNFMSNFNLTRYINFSDVGGVSSCVVSILNENPTFCNITNFNFSFNGNKTINVTLTDNVGNTNTSLNSLVYINPYFEIIFEDSSTNLTITNFNISSSLGNETFNSSFIRKLYDYGIGTHNFTFIKTGYLDRDFNLTFTNSSTINETIVINNAYINIFIYDIMTNALISPNNYTIYYLNEQTGATNIYTITNNNTYSFVNPYDSELNATLQLFNSSSYLVSNRDLVSPRENITFNLYTTNETTRSVSYEVLDASYNQIIGGEVDLYVNIPNTNNFVLQTTKITNIYGRVNFDVVAFQLVYNVCNTNDNVEKCDNLRVFDNLETEYQIVHDSTLNLTTPVNVLGNIIWSYNEDAGTNSSYMTFTFEDTSAQTDEFCINVTRYTNRTATDFYLECNTNYVGQVAQNYSLGEDQYLQYTFLYTENGSFYIPLKTINSYYENQFITYFKNLGIYNYLFLIIIFVIIGSLLEFKSKVFYSIGFLGSTLVLYSIQSYLNYDFIIINMWAIFAVNHLLFWYTNLEN